MDEERTTAAVQRYLDALGGDSPAEPVVRALLDRSVRRLASVMQHASASELPASDAAAIELAGGRDAQCRRGAIAQGPARSPS